jgi:hypothetical protein
MIARHGSIFLAIVFSFGCAYAQDLPGLPAAGDSRHSMLREAMLGLLRDQQARLAAEVRQRCLKLPVDPPNDRLEGPHGDTLVSETCRVAEVRALAIGVLSQWTMARYQWTSIFTAEDRSRGEDARDTVAEEEVVVFDAPDIGELRPVWHARFETGAYAVWRSITPELAATAAGTTLLSVMSCVNGTGGCSQELLQRTVERALEWGQSGVARSIASGLRGPHPAWCPHRSDYLARRGRLLWRPRSELLSVGTAGGRPGARQRRASAAP